MPSLLSAGLSGIRSLDVALLLQLRMIYDNVAPCEPFHDEISQRACITVLKTYQLYAENGVCFDPTVQALALTVSSHVWCARCQPNCRSSQQHVMPICLCQARANGCTSSSLDQHTHAHARLFSFISRSGLVCINWFASSEHRQLTFAYCCTYTGEIQVIMEENRTDEASPQHLHECYNLTRIPCSGHATVYNIHNITAVELGASVKQLRHPQLPFELLGFKHDIYIDVSTSDDEEDLSQISS